MFLKYLRDERRISCVTRVMMHEPLTNLRKVIIIQMKRKSRRSTISKMIALGESFETGEAYLRLGNCYEKLGKNKEPNGLSSLKAGKEKQKALNPSYVIYI
jgi:hypothetical protein